ncbi:hypothetical protein IFT74_05155 [Oxalobacteraceae sp. CFBP 8755]|nr:hypothetical protein [Oxalobacteraceae sp. CFBP 8755]
MAKRQTTAATSKPTATPVPQNAPVPDPVIQVSLPTPIDDVPAPLEQQPEPPPVEVVKAEPAPATAPVPELDDFITVHEKASQAVDLVVTAISHPDAKPRLHVGVYSGFPITTGELLATYSDGSTH